MKLPKGGTLVKVGTVFLASPGYSTNVNLTYTFKDSTGRVLFTATYNPGSAGSGPGAIGGEVSKYMADDAGRTITVTITGDGNAIAGIQGYLFADYM
jgi:hypothetical protein